MKFITKMSVTIIVLSIVVSFVVIAILNKQVEHKSAKKKLKLVHMIYRHGIRTPVDTYPNDPYINETFYPTGWGQITKEGKLDLYKHGKYLRNRYKNFLNKTYHPDEYYVFTTDTDRTQVSAQCINAGLWPPEDEEKWGPINWQPIPIHSEPLDTDHLLLVRRPCPQYNLEQERLLKTTEIQAKLNSYAETFREISEYAGKEINDFDDAQDLFNTLLAESRYKLVLPEWTKSYFPNKLLEPTIFSYIFNAYNLKLNRLKGGVLLKKLIEDWEKAANGRLIPERRKIFLYVGHDATIVNILSTLQIWDPQLPEYAINILFELSQDLTTNEYGIEIFLRNTTFDADPYQLKIPNCEKFCPLEKLIQLTEPVVPKDWVVECRSDDPNYKPPSPRPS